MLTIAVGVPLAGLGALCAGLGALKVAPFVTELGLPTNNKDPTTVDGLTDGTVQHTDHTGSDGGFNTSLAHS